MTGLSGLPAVQASTSKLFQPNTFSAARQARLAPVRVDRRLALGRRQRQAGKRLADRRRDRPRLELGEPDRAGLGDDGRDRVGQDDRRIGQQAAPVAGVVAGVAQLDHQIEVERAAAAEEDRRRVRREARPVGGEQQIGRELRLVALADLAQAGRADLLAGLDQHLGVEAEPAALGDHDPERGEVDRVLALVVGDAAAVDAGRRARVSSQGERPSCQPPARPRTTSPWP